MRARSIFIALVLLFCGINAPSAQQDDFAVAAEGLKARGFGDLIKAVEAIAATGDDRAGPVLRAMSDGNLFVTEDGLIVISQGSKTTNAITGDGVAIDAASLAKVKTNNRLRGVIRTALGGLTLRSRDAARRLQAARLIFNARDASALVALEGAIAAETDADVKTAMQQARAAIILTGDGAETDKLEAIEAIHSMGGQDALGLLNQVSAASDGAVKAAAQNAISDIKSNLALWSGAQNVIYGLSLGSVLLLAAIGLAITFGVMGVINMAHGEMVMVGAYVTFFVQETIRTSAPGLFEWSLMIALPLAFLTSGALGVVLERGIIRFLYGRPLETLLATWGVSLILQQAVRSIFGPNNREVGNPDWMSGSVQLGELTLTWNRLFIIAFALGVFLLLHLLMRKTHFGLQMRAVVQNRRMAGSMGIRTKWIDALTFGLGCGIAGIAGVAISQIDNVSPNLGQSYIIDSFMVVVFGGVGNIWGTLVAAMSLGIANKFLEPFAGAVLGKILVLVFIILFIQKRPRGLFALKGRAVEA